MYTVYKVKAETAFCFPVSFPARFPPTYAFKSSYWEIVLSGLPLVLLMHASWLGGLCDSIYREQLRHE